jgi:hypothetical protein
MRYGENQICLLDTGRAMTVGSTDERDVKDMRQEGEDVMNITRQQKN